MKALRKLANLVFVLVFVLAVVQQAQALPISSYAVSANNWQGSKPYTETVTTTANDGSQISSKLSCRVDFAVYDAGANAPGAEEKQFVQDLQTVTSLTSRYLYVYQVFNDQPDSAAAVTSFAVHNLNSTAMNVSSQNIGSVQDTANGVGPSASGPAAGNLIVWNFGVTAIQATQHSWFLVLGSDSGPVKGAIDVSSSNSDVPAVPEPATIALLSLGSLIFVGQKKRR